MFQNIVGYIIRNRWIIPDIAIFRYIINLPFTFNPFLHNEMRKTPNFTYNGLMLCTCSVSGPTAHNHQITFAFPKNLP